MDRVAPFLKAGAAVGREQRHPERMGEQRETDHAERAPASPPGQRQGQQHQRQQRVRLPEPGDPLARERPRPHQECLGQRLANAGEPAEQAALDLGRRRRRVRRTDRGPRERHHGCQHDGGHEHERRDPPDVRAGGPGPGAATAAPPPDEPGPPASASATVHASRSRARASSAPATSSAASVTSIPESPPQAIGPVHSKATAATVATAGDAPHASAARRVTIAAPTRTGHTDHLDHRHRGAGHEGAGRQQQRPQRRRRARHRSPRVVDEPKPLGDVAREVQMNPRIIERKPRHPRNQPLPNAEQDERQRRGDKELEVGSHSRALPARRKPRRRLKKVQMRGGEGRPD